MSVVVQMGNTACIYDTEHWPDDHTLIFSAIESLAIIYLLFYMTVRLLQLPKFFIVLMKKKTNI
jgi:hypothetical protein